MKKNHLIEETSPYLKQHVNNPVDWYPWGEEALSRAKNEDKPIIVSIGYSTCHWCHVMERESFENDNIAQVMNDNFVCIKVDREERPDVDQVYMDAIGAMGLQGGWPLNVFLMPNKKPFYGGTYFPPHGWLDLLNKVSEVFRTKRPELEESAEEYTKAIKKDTFGGTFKSTNEEIISVNTFGEIAAKIKPSFDLENGGTTGAPKFPMPAIWNFLAQSISQKGNSDYSKQLFLTLDKMALGGIYDQIGGGFSRYSTDNQWFAPHFEKMLYDNGQLVGLYAKAYRINPKSLYKEVVYQSIGWLKREMLHKSGGFYSALDADSEGVEGKFYVWTNDELKTVLGENYELIGKYYNVTKSGNWEKGWNILNRNTDNEFFASEHKLDSDALIEKICNANERLLHERTKRIRPGLDDKILLGWNALMISGLIEAHKAFSENQFLDLARSNMGFLMENMLDGKILFHSYGKKIQAYMDDYGLFIESLIDLYQVTFEEDYINTADHLAAYVIDSFYDKGSNSFFYTSRDSEKLIADKKEIFDNVIPASNSIMAKNLLKLGVMLDNASWTEMAESMLNQVYNLVIKQPSYMSNWASGIHLKFYAPVEIIIVGDNAHNIKTELFKMKLPNHITMGTVTESKLPLLDGRKAVDGKTTIYVCQNKTCQLPVFTVEEALKQISKLN